MQHTDGSFGATPPVRSEGQNVVHGKGHVWPSLCGMAVLSGRPSALTHLYLQFTRERAAAWHPSDALNLGALERVAHESVQ
jgi:hypothetical protein